MRFIDLPFFSIPQGQMAKQFKEYLTQDPFSHFPLLEPQPSFVRDNPAVNLTVSTATTLPHAPDVQNKRVSPKTVSAAVTLSNLEKAHSEEPQWSGRLSPPPKNDTRSTSNPSSVVERETYMGIRPGIEAAIPKETGMLVYISVQSFNW